MSDIEYIRLLHGVHFAGETRSQLPVKGHEGSTSIELKDGVFSVASKDERVEVPMHNVTSFRLVPAKAKAKAV